MEREREGVVTPRKEVLTRSIQACIENGERLIEDADHMDYREAGCTKLVLSMLAQEELAKAFLLYLVREDIVPWSPELLRAMRDHACKHLVGVIMEYIRPDWETTEELKRIIAADYELGGRLPPRVASAVNILRHEKMRRWESAYWFWMEDPEYEPSVLRIAKGARDRTKQEALYVGLGRDGGITSVPTEVTAASADAEYALAQRYRWTIRSLLEHGPPLFFEKVEEILRALFDDRRGETIAL
jgi:AbiV family abortive infection protein